MVLPLRMSTRVLILKVEQLGLIMENRDTTLMNVLTNDLFPLCIRRYVAKSPLFLKRLSQTSHWNGRSPLCIRRCLVK